MLGAVGEMEWVNDGVGRGFGVGVGVKEWEVGFEVVLGEL